MENPAHNLFLALLSKQESLQLQTAKVLRVVAGDILHEYDDPISDVYFPTSAVVSLLSSSPEDEFIGAAVIGPEGFVGYPFAAGPATFPFRVWVLVAGEVIRIPVTTMQRMKKTGQWNDRLASFSALCTTQLAQSAICGNAHTVNQRLARWLLAMNIRSRAPQLEVTHELMSVELNTTRPVTSVAAKELKDAGVISYDRGKIRIVDQSALEAAACGCFKVVYRDLLRLLQRSHPFSHPALDD